MEVRDKVVPYVNYIGDQLSKFLTEYNCDRRVRMRILLDNVEQSEINNIMDDIDNKVSIIKNDFGEIQDDINNNIITSETAKRIDYIAKELDNIISYVVYLRDDHGYFNKFKFSTDV